MSIHEFLEVKTKFNDWISKRIEKYNFTENIDFEAVTQKKVTAQGNEIEVLTMSYKKPEIRKINEIFKRIKETGKLSISDTKYIIDHYWDFQMPMFVRKKR